MNIARALGDKFLKEQDGCFSSQPFVSEAIRIEPESRALAVMARSVASKTHPRHVALACLPSCLLSTFPDEFIMRTLLQRDLNMHIRLDVLV